MNQVERHPFTSSCRIRDPIDGLLVRADEHGLVPAADPDRYGVVFVRDHSSGRLLAELFECLHEPVEVAIVIEMVRLGVRKHGDFGVERQECAVTLVCFYDKPFTFVPDGIRTDLVHVSAHQERGLHPASTRVRAKRVVVVVFPWVPETALLVDRHISQTASQPGSPRAAPLPRESHLVVVVGDRCRDAEQLGVAHEGTVMTDSDLDAHAANRSSAGEAFRSLPVTRWPIVCRT